LLRHPQLIQCVSACTYGIADCRIYCGTRDVAVIITLFLIGYCSLWNDVMSRDRTWLRDLMG
jgi:hypothetical protein